MKKLRETKEENWKFHSDTWGEQLSRPFFISNIFLRYDAVIMKVGKLIFYTYREGVSFRSTTRY